MEDPDAAPSDADAPRTCGPAELVTAAWLFTGVALLLPVAISLLHSLSWDGSEGTPEGSLFHYDAIVSWIGDWSGALLLVLLARWAGRLPGVSSSARGAWGARLVAAAALAAVLAPETARALGLVVRYLAMRWKAGEPRSELSQIGDSEVDSSGAVEDSLYGPQSLPWPLVVGLGALALLLFLARVRSKTGTGAIVRPAVARAVLAVALAFLGLKWVVWTVSISTTYAALLGAQRYSSAAGWFLLSELGAFLLTGLLLWRHGPSVAGLLVRGEVASASSRSVLLPPARTIERVGVAIVGVTALATSIHLGTDMVRGASDQNAGISATLHLVLALVGLVGVRRLTPMLRGLRTASPAHTRDEGDAPLDAVRDVALGLFGAYLIVHAALWLVGEAENWRSWSVRSFGPLLAGILIFGALASLALAFSLRRQRKRRHLWGAGLGILAAWLALAIIPALAQWSALWFFPPSDEVGSSFYSISLGGGLPAATQWQLALCAVLVVVCLLLRRRLLRPDPATPAVFE